MSYLRIAGVFLFLAPFTAMFGEPFYEALFDLLGWDSETWAAPAMTWVFGNTGLLFFAMGVGVGIWVHYLALRVASRGGLRARQVDWDFLERELDHIKQLLAFDIAKKDNVAEGYSPIGMEGFNAFYALLIYLHERGMAPKSGIPDPRMMKDHDFFFKVSTRYIASIEPYIRAKDREKIASYGEGVINLVYQWENEERRDAATSADPEHQSPESLERFRRKCNHRWPMEVENSRPLFS